MDTSATHPTDRALRAYGLGELDGASAKSIRSHVAGCPACRRRAAEVASDSFLGRRRDADAGRASPGPRASSTDGLSMLGTAPVAVAPPPAGSLPPGLADHPDYEVLQELGRGGMGVVYLARNTLMGRLEVLKVVGAHLIRKPAVRDRFLREIRSAAQLHHPNIVTAYSALRLGESLGLAMEYVEGLDLSRVVKARGPLPVSNACNYVQQAALGLQHAHEHGMVHRDIKPSNLMLARQGKRPVVKLLDFGLAKVTSEGQADNGLTREGQMLGTPDYIAPEQIRNSQAADIRADIYSLGCTLYYLLTAAPPFAGDNLWDLYQAHFSMDASPLSLVRHDAPVELAALVAKMMAKDPGRRFQTPGEVALALLPFFKPTPAQSSVSSGETSGVHPQVSPARPSAVGPARDQSALIGPPPLPPALRTPKTGGDGVAWESLIAIQGAEPPTTAARPRPMEPAPAPADGPARRPPWVWASAAAAVFIFLLTAAWIGGVFKVRTSEGVIVVTNVPEDSEIFVDGEKMTFTWPGQSKPLEIRAVTGRHRVEVKADGFETQGEFVTVKTGESAPMTVSLEPLRDRSRAASDPDAQEDAGTLNGRAWDLATAGEASDRDGAKAIELATRACKKDGFQSAQYVDTLAAAHAEAGHFEEAVKWQTRAIEMPGSSEDRAEFRARLKLYRRKKPYHQGEAGAAEPNEGPATAESPGRPNPVDAGEPGRRHPDEVGGARSLNSEVSTTITFVNQSTQPVKAYWLDFEGRRVLYATIEAGQAWSSGTFVTHPWVITDASDRAWNIYYPTEEPRTVEIEAPR